MEEKHRRGRRGGGGAGEGSSAGKPTKTEGSRGCCADAGRYFFVFCILGTCSRKFFLRANVLSMAFTASARGRLLRRDVGDRTFRFVCVFGHCTCSFLRRTWQAVRRCYCKKRHYERICQSKNNLHDMFEAAIFFLQPTKGGGKKQGKHKPAPGGQTRQARRH